MLETLDVWSSALVAGLIAALMVPVNLMPDSVSEAFQYAFMQRALLTSMMVGAICGMLSCYVVLKRWSLLGDAISHAVLPGVAVAYLLGLPFFYRCLRHWSADVARYWGNRAAHAHQIRCRHGDHVYRGICAGRGLDQ